MTTGKKPPIADLPDWPLLMNIKVAAAYVGLAPNTFAKYLAPQLFAIRIGREPKPGGRDQRPLRYDRRQIDDLVDRLRGSGNPAHDYLLEQLDDGSENQNRGRQANDGR